MEHSEEIEERESLTALVSFYRSRFDELEKERQEWLNRVSSCEVSHEQVHRVKWELRVREEEINELQNALSDANVQLFEEREEALKLLAENDQLKMQQIEDRRRIQHLLALTEPVSQEVTFFKDCRPYLMTRKLHAQQQLAQTHLGFERDENYGDVGKPEEGGIGKSKAESVIVKPNEKLCMSSSESNGNKGGGRVLRTIYLPNEQTDGLNMRVQSLQQQLEDLGRVSKQRIDALEKDRVDREEAFKREKTLLKEEVAALEEKLENAELSTRAATKDYLDLRLSAQSQERTTMERLATLESENQSLRIKLNTLADKLSRETEAIRSSIIEDGERQVQRFRRQAIVAEDQLNKLKQSNHDELREAQEEAAALKVQVSALTKKNGQLQQRRQLDFEGFTKDIGELRKQIRTLESVAYGSLAKRLSKTDENDSGHAAELLNDGGPSGHRSKAKARADILRNEIEKLQESIGKLDVQGFFGYKDQTDSQVGDEEHGKYRRKVKSSRRTKPAPMSRRGSQRPQWVD